VKKRKIRAITAFKVIQGHRGRYQSKARMLFPISDSNWHPISYRFGVIAAYCSISLQRGHFDSKFYVEGAVPHQSFLHRELGQWMPYKSVLTVFTHVLLLRRYERKYIENRRFHTNAVTLIPNFRYKGSPTTNNFCTIS